MRSKSDVKISGSKPSRVFLGNGFCSHSLRLILKGMIFDGAWETFCGKQVNQCSENLDASGSIVDDSHASEPLNYQIYGSTEKSNQWKKQKVTIDFDCFPHHYLLKCCLLAQLPQRLPVAAVLAVV